MNGYQKNDFLYDTDQSARNQPQNELEELLKWVDSLIVQTQSVTSKSKESTRFRSTGDETSQSSCVSMQPTLNRHTNKHRIFFSFRDMIFYALLLGAVAGIFLFPRNDETPRSLFGYSWHYVETASMQSVLPVGSLVVSKDMDSALLQIGDDITFLTSKHRSVTHRIVDIHENYKGTEKRVFQTKGIENSAPDEELVASGSIIGKVVFHVEKLGTVAEKMQQHIWLVIGFCALFMLLVLFLRVYALEKKREKQHIAITDQRSF